MRVFHINCNYIYSTLHQNMIRELNRLDIYNYVFVPVYDPDKGSVEPIENVNVFKCFSRYDRIWFHIKQKKIYKTVMKINNLGSYNCIHAYTLFTDGFCAMKVSKTLGIPYVVAVRNTDVNAFFKHMPHLRKTGVEVLENASKVFFLSEEYRKTVLDRYVPAGLRQHIIDKSVVIPNGIDDYWHDHLYCNKNIKENIKRFENKTVRLIYAGNVDRNKNIGLTAEAVKILNARGWHVTLDIVGPVVDEKEFKKLIKNEGLEYTQQLSKEELIEKYRQADMFVMPSHNESFGLVYAEAMSQSLPVIYTRGQGFDGQFSDGQIGFSTSDSDSYELSNLILKVIDNYPGMCSNCLKSVAKFKWNAIAEQYKDIYETIVV